VAIALWTDPKVTEVWTCLDRVMDPELDEPITDMGFVEAVSVTEAGDVNVAFRLPTYWCSPNFAFLMAQGIKREVDALRWVRRTVVQLQDHMAADEMNAAVNAGGAFSDAFTELRDDQNLEALRDKFERKAFQRRQEVAIKALLTDGQSVTALLSMPLGVLRGTTFPDVEDQRQTGRYLDLLHSRDLAVKDSDPAFVTCDGEPIKEEGFATYMDLLRSVRINMDFSGSLCRGLKRSRYKQADLSGDAPTLVDFIRQGPDAPHSVSAATDH